MLGRASPTWGRKPKVFLPSSSLCPYTDRRIYAPRSSTGQAHSAEAERSDRNERVKDEPEKEQKIMGLVMTGHRRIEKIVF